MRTWQTEGPDRSFVCEVSDGGVSVGETRGDPHTDAFQSCTHAEFLAGRFEGVVRAHHGDAVLAEVREEVRRRAR
ncbi:MAG: hypothetical protein KF729_33560 [Sandaracinaceae bacterium]|nr:hypothetical protein [Sandaracinaceae bacterium]